MAKAVNHVVLSKFQTPDTFQAVCQRCGEHLTIGLPVPVTVLCVAAAAFEKAHAECVEIDATDKQ